MTVIVDIDNVLNNFTETVLAHYNKDYNTNHKIEDINRYSMEDALNIPFHTLNKYFTSNRVLSECIPIKDSQKYLKILNQMADVYIVTAREWTQLEHITDWFSKYFPFIEDRQIIRCRDKHIIQGDIRIDDHLDNLLNCFGGRIVFDYPFNRNIDDMSNFIYRAYNWKDCFSMTMLMLGFDSKTIIQYYDAENSDN